MGSIVVYAIQAFGLVKEAIAAGMALKDAYDLLAKYQANIQKMKDFGRGVLPEEWDAINKETEDLRAARPDVNKEN